MSEPTSIPPAAEREADRASPINRSIVPFAPEAMRAQGLAPGWVAGEDGLLAHPTLGIRLVRVMICETDRILYDTVLHAERGGGVFLPVDASGRIGLQQVWRPQTRDQDAHAASFPEVDLALLGRTSYEAPRGFGERGEAGGEAAVREAEEETRGKVSERAPLGQICDNTTFSPHLTEAVWGRVDLGAEATGDPMEGILGRLQFFARAELAEMQREGLLYDSFTLAALALLWMEHPELFEARRGDDSIR